MRYVRGEREKTYNAAYYVSILEVLGASKNKRISFCSCRSRRLESVKKTFSSKKKERIMLSNVLVYENVYTKKTCLRGRCGGYAHVMAYDCIA